MVLASKLMSPIPPQWAVPLIAWQYRFFETELRRLDEFVPADRGAIDVGVWWGPWSWWLARRVPRVDSFEANPELVASLMKAMPSNVTLHSVALSDRSGEASLWIPSGGVGTEGRSSIEPGWREFGGNQLTVATCRLDDFELGDVGFVKIDVEGHEFPVLRGATELLKMKKPNLMVEIEQRSHDETHFDSIIEFLGSLSYSGRFLSRGKWRPIEEFDRKEAQRLGTRTAKHGYFTNLALYARKYVNNFLFTAD